MSSRQSGEAAAPFAADFGALSERSPQWGDIRLLPWDGEVFGFSVAEYRPGELGQLVGHAHAVEENLLRWTNEMAADLVSCRVPADSPELSALLQSIGFRVVECQLRATLPKLRAEELREPRLTIRAVEPEDHARLIEIAERAFAFGRYHGDARFPRPLADRRYRRWIERVLAAPSGGERLLVTGPTGRPTAFLHAEAVDGEADIRLAAVDPGAGVPIGPDLYLGALRELAAAGASRVSAVLSAANTPMINLYASFGFRFHEPQIVFHWHRPGSRNLLSVKEARQNETLDGRTPGG